MLYVAIGIELWLLYQVLYIGSVCKHYLTYTVHCTLYTVIVQCTLYTIYTVHYSQYNVHNVQLLSSSRNLILYIGIYTCLLYQDFLI